MTDQAAPQRKHGILYVVIILLLLCAGAGVWIIMETLDKGEPTLPFITGSQPPSSPPETAEPDRDTRDREASLPETIFAPPAERQQPETAGNDAGFILPPGEQAVVLAPENQPLAAPPEGGDSPDPVELPSDDPQPQSGEFHPAVVRLARLMADNYWPRGEHPQARSRGITTFSVKQANLLFGVQFAGLGANPNNPVASRAAVLRRWLGGGGLPATARSWSEDLPAALEQAASTRTVGDTGRALSADETREMFRISARQARALAGAVSVYLDDAALPGLVAAYHKAEDTWHQANMQYLDRLADHERAKDLDAAVDELDRLARQAEAAASTYQEAVRHRQEAQAALVRAMNANPDARSLGDGSLLYTAEWLYRRGNEAAPAMREAVGLLRTTADRLSLKAE